MKANMVPPFSLYTPENLAIPTLYQTKKAGDPNEPPAPRSSCSPDYFFVRPFFAAFGFAYRPAYFVLNAALQRGNRVHQCGRTVDNRQPIGWRRLGRVASLFQRFVS